MIIVCNPKYESVCHIGVDANVRSMLCSASAASAMATPGSDTSPDAPYDRTGRRKRLVRRSVRTASSRLRRTSQADTSDEEEGLPHPTQDLEADR